MNRLLLPALAALVALASFSTDAAETTYLAFQIFEGMADPVIPFDYPPLVYTPRDKVAAIARDIITRIGVTGGANAKLAVIVGPIAFDHTDAEARQIIADGFAIALAENVAIGFHLDDSMFWSARTDLIGDPANVEWTDFSGALSTGLKLDWAHPPARMCYNAPAIQAEVTRRARDVIGAEIAAQVAILPAEKKHLFAGVITGWESHMGQDVGANSQVGFHALSNRGFGPGNPSANVGTEIASVVAEFMGRWTDGLAQAGIDPTRVYTHVAFMTKAYFGTLALPANTTYQALANSLPSTAQPSVAFVTNSRAGFSTYPAPGRFDQIQEERALRGGPAWASCEGSNSLGGRPGDSGITMETYLARCFNHGATLVDLFGWGIGGTFVTNNPYRLATEEPAAIAAYRKFLNGQALVETVVPSPPVAASGSVSTPEDTAKAITLIASGVDGRGQPLTYSIVANPMHGALTGVGTSRTYIPAANYNGPDSFTFRAYDGALNSNTATVSIAVAPLDYASWKTRYFTTAQQADPAIAGENANPSGDGMINLFKYAFGLSPDGNGPTYWPTIRVQDVSGTNYLQFSYRRQSFAKDLTYTVEVSDDLIIWNRGPNSTVFVSQSDNGDGTYQVIVRDATPISSQPRHFMRLQVTQT